MKLKQFQENAVSVLAQKVTDTLFVRPTSKTTKMIFQAPTGAGKTIILGSLVDRLIRSPYRGKFAFLWISPATGGLLEQNSTSLLLKKSDLDLAFAPFLLTSESLFGSNVHDDDNLYFLNWEKVNRKDSSNKLNKPNDHGKTFLTFIQELKLSGKKIVLIIDEAHLNRSSKISKDILKLISADIELLVSATPKIESGVKSDTIIRITKNKPKDDRDIQTLDYCYEIEGLTLSSTSHVSMTKEKEGLSASNHVVVRREEAIVEGLLRSRVILNEGLEGVRGNTIDALLEAALTTRERLRNEFQRIGSHVNPLLLIQVENGTYYEGLHSDEVLSTIVRGLSSHGISVENRNLAFYFSGEKINYSADPKASSSESFDDLRTNWSRVDALIFKTAIATGWDCPRSYILLKLREVDSESLELQTLGRALRMPEQRSYGTDASPSILDNAYIYSPVDTDEKVRLLQQDYDIATSKEDNLHFIYLKPDQKINFSMNTYVHRAQSVTVSASDLGTAIRARLCKKYDLTMTSPSRDYDVLERQGFKFDGRSSKKVVFGKEIGLFHDDLVFNNSHEDFIKKKTLYSGPIDVLRDYYEVLKKETGLSKGSLATSLTNVLLSIFAPIRRNLVTYVSRYYPNFEDLDFISRNLKLIAPDLTDLMANEFGVLDTTYTFLSEPFRFRKVVNYNAIDPKTGAPAYVEYDPSNSVSKTPIDVPSETVQSSETAPELLELLCKHIYSKPILLNESLDLKRQFIESLSEHSKVIKWWSLNDFSDNRLTLLFGDDLLPPFAIVNVSAKTYLLFLYQSEESIPSSVSSNLAKYNDATTESLIVYPKDETLHYLSSIGSGSLSSLSLYPTES